MMLDKRIVNSLQQELSFDDLFNSNKIRINRSESMIESHENRYMDVFQYMTELTLHRPRDLIKFCKCIQHELSESHPTKISFRTIKNAELSLTQKSFILCYAPSAVNHFHLMTFTYDIALQKTTV